MARVIGRDERDALYHAIRRDLRHLGYLAEALADARLTVAAMLARRCRAELRLLDDLGWKPHDPRGQYELTLPEPEAEHAVVERDPLAAAICRTVVGETDPAIVRDASEPLPEEW